MNAMIDRIAGDSFGLPFPAHPDALREDGIAFLTAAFRAAGSLGETEVIARITRFEECIGGSTGRKLRLGVEYANNTGVLPTDLFVKFSRDFNDPIRDRARIQMESEVRFALLSRVPGFPIAVPQCLFADYCKESGTGILISEEIAFGKDGIERHYDKCCDSELPDSLGHYRALMRALAQLSGSHRAGRFPAGLVDGLASESTTLGVSDRQHYSAGQVGRRIERYAEFAARHPQLLPEAIRTPAFLAQLAEQAPRFCGHERAIEDFLAGSRHFRALCHWNANIDNAWFWRDTQGELQCGLMDWGNAQPMNIGVALAGCLMAAEPDFLTANLTVLLAEFTCNFKDMSGEVLDPSELLTHLALHNACSGLLWLIDAPAMIERYFPDLDVLQDRFDPRFRSNELVRNQLHMLTVFLSLWRALDFGKILDGFLDRKDAL